MLRVDSPVRWPRLAMILVGAWAIPGLISTSQSYVLAVARSEPLSFIDALIWCALPFQLWALATPLILALMRRFPLARGRWPLSVAVHVAASAALTVADQWFAIWCGRLAGQPPFVEFSTGALLPWFVLKAAFLDIVLYGGVIVAASAVIYRRRYREEALSRAQLEARLAEAQLHALKMQLHPHFLFNTLNAISVLVRKADNPRAIRMLTGLGDLLRRSLNGLKVEFGTVREELDFLRRYLDIETMRFPDRLQVEIDAGPEVLDARLPVMILQPVVENAIKHGLSPRAAGGRLEIAIRGSEDGARLQIAVRDDGVGLPGGAAPADGVGLGHVRSRLAQLYPGRHRFTLAPDPRGGAIATLEIPREPGAGTACSAAPAGSEAPAGGAITAGGGPA